MTDIGEKFRALHRCGAPFVLMNAWDVGSARVMAALGAQAIGTSSAAHAFTLGLPDMGHVTRDQALAHAQDLVAAVSLPVSGDFENGYGDGPDDVAQTVRLAAEAGLAGLSIEDTCMDGPIAYDFDLAVERVKAGAAAARALGRDFVFVARADGIMNGFYDVDEAIRRLRAFDAAGADCLYAPLPKTRGDLQRILACTDKPVNVLAAGKWAKISRAEYAAMGVARISLGSAPARVVHKVLVDMAQAIAAGDFTGFNNAASGADIDALLAKGGVQSA